MQFINLKRQYELIKDEVNQAIQQVLDEGSFILGPQVGTLEDLLAEHVGVKHCISVSSGTDSLLIALMALDIGLGDEVITVPFSWISPSEVIALVGAKPVFVDIDPETFNIDVNQIEQAITPKTKAIMPVSLFGQMPDYTVINAIAESHGLPVIEDGAQSFGATQNGRLCCGLTTIASTSFFPAKTLGCYGDGGAIFTNDDTLMQRMRAIRIHGSDKKYQHFHLGLTGRLDTIQAAVLLAKFPHFASEIETRQKIGRRYSELLKECCVVPKVQEGNTHVYSPYTIRVFNRDEVAKELNAQGIPTGIYYPRCLHEQPVFSVLGYKRGSFPIAEKASMEVLSLPMHPWLSVEEQDHVVEVFKKVVGERGYPK